MPVISTYSSSSSSYISPSSYRYKSSLSDRRSYTTSITSSSSGTTGSSFYRRSSYRYDLPSSSSAYSSSSASYRSTAAAASDRAADTELSNSLSTLATSSASAAEVGSSTGNGTKESVASRPSRYSSGYGSYGSRISSRSSDGGRTQKDRENNCYCAGGAGSSTSSSGYASSLRNTALSGADIYQKYSVSTFSSRPSIYERIAASRPEKPASSVVSIASASAALDSSKSR